MYNNKSQYICRKHNTKKQLLSNEITPYLGEHKLETRNSSLPTIETPRPYQFQY